MHFVANKITVPTIPYACRKQRMNITIYTVRRSLGKAESRVGTHSTINSASNINHKMSTFTLHSKKCYLTEILQEDNGVFNLKHAPYQRLIQYLCMTLRFGHLDPEQDREILRNVGNPYNFDTVPNPNDCTPTSFFSYLLISGEYI